MRFALQVGLVLKCGQRTLELVRELEGGSYLIEDVATRRPTEFTRKRLLDDIYAKRLLVIVGEKPLAEGADAEEQTTVLDLSTLSANERAQLEYRLLYVKVLDKKKITRGQRSTVTAAIKETASRHGHARQPSATAVMLWARKYQTSGMNVFALIDRHRMRRSPKRRANINLETFSPVIKSPTYRRVSSEEGGKAERAPAQDLQ